jgi:hypothetical protein
LPENPETVPAAHLADAFTQSEVPGWAKDIERYSTRKLGFTHEMSRPNEVLNPSKSSNLMSRALDPPKCLVPQGNLGSWREFHQRRAGK